MKKSKICYPFAGDAEDEYSTNPAFFPLLYSHKEIKEYLKKGDCPLDFEEIGVDREVYKKAILYSRFIRDRLTVLDIADELGILEESLH